MIWGLHLYLRGAQYFFPSQATREAQHGPRTAPGPPQMWPRSEISGAGTAMAWPRHVHAKLWEQT